MKVLSTFAILMIVFSPGLSAASPAQSDSQQITDLLVSFYRPWIGRKAPGYDLYRDKELVKKFLTPAFQKAYDLGAGCADLGDNPFMGGGSDFWIKSMRIVVEHNDGMSALATIYFSFTERSKEDEDILNKDPWYVRFKLSNSGGKWLIDNVRPRNYDWRRDELGVEFGCTEPPKPKPKPKRDWVPEERHR
jgi:hypothetical protein